MAETGHVEEPKKFAPKDPPKLNPPLDEAISVEDLAKCDGTTAICRTCGKGDLIVANWSTHGTGTDSSYPTYVAIMGTVFDVSGNTAYSPKNPYNGTDMPIHFQPLHTTSSQLTQIPVFAGKDASRALAQSSLKSEDCRPEWQDLPEKEKGVLKDWFTFFSKRYNIVGKVQL